MGVQAVYSELQLLQYHSHKPTAKIFSLLCLLGIVLLPIPLGLYTEGFWLLRGSYLEQPEVHLTGIIAHWTMADGSPVVYSTEDTYLAALGSGAETRAPGVSVEEIEEVVDGVPEEISVKLSLPVEAGEVVVQAQVMLLLSYKIDEFARVEMEGLVLFGSASGAPSSRMQGQGDVRLRQFMMLPPAGDLINLDGPVLDTVVSTRDARLAEMMGKYYERNETLLLVDDFYSWTPGPATGTFDTSLTLRVPLDKIYYRPGLGSVLKHAWNQYFALLFVVSSAIVPFWAYAYTSGALETMTKLDDEPYQLTF